LGEGRQPGFDVHQRESGDRGQAALVSRGVCEATLRRAADGFYEWRGPKVRREPLWIHPATDSALLLFAGLFEAWQFQPGQWQTTFTLLTTSANRTLEQIHNRMPVSLLNILGETCVGSFLAAMERLYPLSGAARDATRLSMFIPCAVSEENGRRYLYPAAVLIPTLATLRTRTKH
jgi:SOS response associated peptidase (SRAP)